MTPLVAMDIATLALFDAEVARPTGTNQHTEGVNNVHTLDRPVGNSKQAGIRRLRSQRPDLLARVTAGPT